MVFGFSMGVWQYGRMNLKQRAPEALERRLKYAVEAAGGVGDVPLWMAGFGALSDLGDENRRIIGLIEQEFETLHSEDMRGSHG